jgi:hypothetical protein
MLVVEQVTGHGFVHKKEILLFSTVHRSDVVPTPSYSTGNDGAFAGQRHATVRSNPPSAQVKNG